MPRLSRVQVARACESAARITRYSPPVDAQVHTLPDALTSPFEGQAKIAWTNGQTFFAPCTPVPVLSAHPRARSITLDSNARVH